MRWPDEGDCLDRTAAGAVIEQILRHCGLLIPSTPRAPPPEDGWVYEPDGDWENQPISSEQSGELTFVEIDEFLAVATF